MTDGGNGGDDSVDGGEKVKDQYVFYDFLSYTPSCLKYYANDDY